MQITDVPVKRLVDLICPAVIALAAEKHATPERPNVASRAPRALLIRAPVPPDSPRIGRPRRSQQQRQFPGRDVQAVVDEVKPAACPAAHAADTAFVDLAVRTSVDLAYLLEQKGIKRTLGYGLDEARALKRLRFTRA